MTTSLETRTHLALTEAFIAANPTDVVAYRSARVPDGAGGTTQGSATAVAAICGRLVGRNVNRQPTATTDGTNQLNTEPVFVCMPDTDLDVGDYFDVGDVRYTVTTVGKNPPWRLQAELAVSE